jgi:hypothetical protein
MKMTMKFLTAALILAAAPAFAEPACTPGDVSAPIWQSMKAFEESGGKVLAFKINDGQCYEIYGVVDGVKMEVFYDPNTGAEIERIEA